MILPFELPISDPILSERILFIVDLDGILVWTAAVFIVGLVIGWLKWRRKRSVPMIRYRGTRALP